MAVKKVAVGDWVDGEFRHGEWETGVDTVGDPDGNPIGGGTAAGSELLHEDTLLNDVENPAPWMYNPQPLE